MTEPEPKLRYAMDTDFDFLIEGLETVRTIEKRPPKDIPASDADREKYRNAIKDQRVRVVEKAGQPVAFLHFRTDFQVMLIYEPFLWIDLIYVHQDHRGHGFGQMLYKDATKIAKEQGLSRIVLDVFAVNEPSRQFHEKMGFEPLFSICHKWI
jgi:GNAT superfamily N-acetyltransferase